jgi:hypothetical protein
MAKKFILGILCLLITGCAYTTKLAGESESNIRIVSVDRNVKLPEKPFFFGPAQTLGGGLFGGIGAAMAQATMREDRRIAEYMKQNQIDIGDIVLEEFESRVKEHPKFVNRRFVQDTDNADAKFEVEVVMFGLSQIHGLSRQYRPVLNVRARLISAQGKK